MLLIVFRMHCFPSNLMYCDSHFFVVLNIFISKSKNEMFFSNYFVDTKFPLKTSHPWIAPAHILTLVLNKMNPTLKMFPHLSSCSHRTIPLWRKVRGQSHYHTCRWKTIIYLAKFVLELPCVCVYVRAYLHVYLKFGQVQILRSRMYTREKVSVKFHFT